jgi:hypothetical protein
MRGIFPSAATTGEKVATAGAQSAARVRTRRVVERMGDLLPVEDSALGD